MIDPNKQPPIGMKASGELLLSKLGEQVPGPKVYLDDGTILTWQQAQARFGKKVKQQEKGMIKRQK